MTDFDAYLALGLIASCVVIVCGIVLKVNEMNKEKEELIFCREIYNSDHVILEQCKNYFVIIDGLNE